MKGNLGNMKKLINLHGKQTYFTQKLGNELSDDILNLDVTHSKLKISSREMIVGIQSCNDTLLNPFHVANKSREGDRVVFCFHSPMKPSQE